MVSKLLPKHRNEARLSLFQTIEGGSSAACEVVEMINGTNKTLLYSLINICQFDCRNNILKFDHAFMDHNPMPHYCFCDIMNQICCISEKNNQGSSSHDGAPKDIARSGEGLLLLQTQGARQNLAGSALCQVKKPRV